MKLIAKPWLIILVFILGFCLIGAVSALAADKPADDAQAFPRSLESYNDGDVQSIFAILKNRVKQEF